MYRDSKNNPYWILDGDDKPISCDACPISVITDESLELIQIDRKQRLAKEATGAMLYGPDLSKWPSKIVDAITIIQGQANITENARQESEYR